MLKLTFALAIVTVVVLGVGCSGSTSKSSNDSGGTSSGGASSAGKSSGGSNSGGASSNAGSSNGGSSSGGASSNAGSSSNAGAASAGAPNWQLWSACSVAEDCTVIPIQSCCGCVATGVNTTYEKQARASNANFNASACGQLGCANFPCPPDSMVACEMGRCLPKPGCSVRDELSCEADQKCQKYSARACTTAGTVSYVACGKPKVVCNQAPTCRVSPSGQQLLFPDGCVPDGYEQACPSQCGDGGMALPCGGQSACPADQYCYEFVGGPAGSVPSYSCKPLGNCQDCKCLNVVGCQCSGTGNAITVFCAAP